MKRNSRPQLPRERLGQAVVFALLFVAAGLAIAGPSGLLAWSRNAHQLASSRDEVTRLMAERDRLRNRVNLLDPRHADPDLVGELLRSNLNVAHPDEIVIDRR
jgi:cell division protein FtsB